MLISFFFTCGMGRVNSVENICFSRTGRTRFRSERTSVLRHVRYVTRHNGVPLTLDSPSNISSDNFVISKTEKRNEKKKHAFRNFSIDAEENATLVPELGGASRLL